MLIRPGSAPGSGWMRDVSDRLASGPADTRPVPRRFWVLYLVFMISALAILPMLGRRSMPSYNVRSYESSSRIAGLPVFASGAAPVAIIAIGGRPRGVIAIGGLAFGVVAVGGVAVGGFAIGGVSLGFLALGGLAIGWRALGGGAIGYRAFGGLAIGGGSFFAESGVVGGLQACG